MTALQRQVEDIEEQEANAADDCGDMAKPFDREEQKHRFVVMRAKGYSYARIARELRVSKGTLTAWIAEMEADIARTRAMELESLQEEFSMLKEGRIRLIGEQLKAIQAEIGRRDLSKVNTDKLLELQLRYFEQLKGGYVETGQRTRTGPQLNSGDIAQQLHGVLARYRAGEIDESQAELEQTILQSVLKAIEQTELAAKLERAGGGSPIKEVAYYGTDGNDDSGQNDGAMGVQGRLPPGRLPQRSVGRCGETPDGRAVRIVRPIPGHSEAVRPYRGRPAREESGIRVWPGLRGRGSTFSGGASTPSNASSGNPR